MRSSAQSVFSYGMSAGFVMVMVHLLGGGDMKVSTILNEKNMSSF